MNLDSATIEITRRCNMRCDHCLRGEAQKLDITDEILDKFFSQVYFIRSMTITGGEPSLAPDRIRAIIRIAQANNVEIANFYIVTNGKRVSQEFMDALQEMYDFCSDNDESWVNVSRDDYHCESSKSGVSRLIDWWHDLTRDSYLWRENGDVMFKTNKSLLNMGNALGSGDRGISVFRLDIHDTDGENYIEGTVYVNAKGNVLPHCDFDYEHQEELPLIICSVNENIREAIKEFGKRKIDNIYDGIDKIYDND